MRIGQILTVLFAFGGLATHKPSSAQDIDLSVASTRPTPQLQRGRQSQELRAGTGLQMALFARRLGQISAMVADASGTIYVADQRSGRIYTLLDRNQDGLPEQQRPLPHQFDGPTGLALDGETLYVADRSAVWVVNGGRPPALLARLANAKSTGVHRLAPAPVKNGLALTYISTVDGTSRHVSINRGTGVATLLDKAKATQSHLAGGGGIPLLTARTDGSAGILSINTQATDPLPALSDISGLAVADQASPAWPTGLGAQLLISRPIQGDVLALPMALGRILPRGRGVFAGFTSDTGRTQWGQPGPLLMTEFGLLVADPVNGDIYRLSRAPTPPAVQTPPPAPALPKTAAKEQSRSGKKPEVKMGSQMRGSGIKTGSQIQQGSMLTEGSQIKPSEPAPKD